MRLLQPTGPIENTLNAIKVMTFQLRFLIFPYDLVNRNVLGSYEVDAENHFPLKSLVACPE